MKNLIAFCAALAVLMFCFAKVKETDNSTEEL